MGLQMNKLNVLNNIVRYNHKEWIALCGQVILKYDIHIAYHYYSDGHVSGKINNWVFSWPQCDLLPYIVEGASCAGGTLAEKEQLSTIVMEYIDHIHTAIEDEQERRLIEKTNNIIMLYEDEVV
jgi:hypothetical protein